MSCDIIINNYLINEMNNSSVYVVSQIKIHVISFENIFATHFEYVKLFI